MEIILSAIAAGGLVGASDQYLCLLIVSIATKVGWIELAPAMGFMGSWWFLGLSAVFWLLSAAPAYATLLSPGVMNVVNSISKFMSGFLIPLSSALIALASIGVISSMNPELNNVLQSLKIFSPDGGLGPTAFLISGASAAAGLTVTGIKALAKPALSAGSGTMGHISAPIFATIENVFSIILMVVAYLLTKVDPWLLVALFGLVVAISIGVLVFAIIQLWRLKKGIGRVMYLTQTNPKAGLAILAEFFVWGTGWFAWKFYGRGIVMILLWVLWVTFFISVHGFILTALAFFPPAIPVVTFFTVTMLLVIFIAIGMGSARSIMREVDKPAPKSLPQKP